MADTPPRNNTHCSIPDDPDQSTYRFIIVAAKRAPLTGRKVITGIFSSASPEATLSSSIEHIGVAQEHDLLLVAPASAGILAKFANGLADDFLSTMYLAFRGPVVLAPAMNNNMWEHEATRNNLAILRRRGHTIVDPDDGFRSEE